MIFGFFWKSGVMSVVLSKGNGQKSKMDGDEPGYILLMGLVSVTLLTFMIKKTFHLFM